MYKRILPSQKPKINLLNTSLNISFQATKRLKSLSSCGLVSCKGYFIKSVGRDNRIRSEIYILCSKLVKIVLYDINIIL